MEGERLERFERLRPRLVRHAYRMLGVASDAEDIVQDAFLRWSGAIERSAVENDAAFLRTTVTRLAIDRLRSARARREVYAGPWLPEPVVCDPAEDPEGAAVLADDVSMALLLALERLSPLERAAFLLHDTFDVPFGEIAATLDRSEAAVRQLASRAREHVREARPRNPPTHAQALRIRDAFARATSTGDLAALQQLLHDDVVFTSDGGGKVPAAIVPVAGPDHVGRMLVGLARKGAELVKRIELASINGLPGFVILGEDAVLQTLALEIAGEKIAAIYVTRNPDKLRGIAARFGAGASAPP